MTKQNKSKDLSLTASGKVSFGKVFLTLVATQVDKTMCDELQIFFYGLNDECGWVSGFSVAEFPIDMKILSDAYNEKIKTLGTPNLQVETMLSVIVDSHFSEPSAEGYGMSKFYGQDPKDKKKIIEKKDQTSVTGIAEFVKNFGDLRLPMIEMFTETVSCVEDNKEVIVKRIHIYDKLNSPYGFEQQVLDSKEGFVIQTLDKVTVRDMRNAAIGSYLDLKKLSWKQLNDEKKNRLEAAKNAGTSAEATKLATKTSSVEILDASERGAIKSYLTSKLPTLRPGTNGSLILSISAASKTDGNQGSINLINSLKSKNPKLSGADDGLSDAKNLPLRSVPMQVTMSTLGVPTAALYQKYFIDFNTGTTIDNIYNCNQIQHSMSQGKFTTNWTFIYDNGYARFISPASMNSLIIGGYIEEIEKKIEAIDKAAADAAAEDAKNAKFNADREADTRAAAANK